MSGCRWGQAVWETRVQWPFKRRLHDHQTLLFPCMACAPSHPSLQPFRGWGHSWPGHFLPTDRVAHWSLREAPGTAVVAAQEFKRVAPRVPKVRGID